MASGKRYYWIKLSENFFTSDTVDFLMSQKDGSQYIVLYQMLCLKTANNHGVLQRKLGDVLIPYDAEKIQRDCKWFSIDTVRIALTLYKKLGLIYVEEDGTEGISNIDRIVGSETDWAIAKRDGKQSLKSPYGKSPENVSDDFHKILDIDKDIDTDIDKDKDKDTDTTPSQAKQGFLSEYLKTLSDYYIHDPDITDKAKSDYKQACFELIQQYGKESFEKALIGFIHDGDYKYIRDKLIFFRSRMKEIMEGSYKFKSNIVTDAMPASQEKLIELLEPLKKACSDMNDGFDLNFYLTSLNGATEEQAREAIAERIIRERNGV